MQKYICFKYIHNFSFRFTSMLYYHSILSQPKNGSSNFKKYYIKTEFLGLFQKQNHKYISFHVHVSLLKDLKVKKPMQIYDYVCSFIYNPNAILHEWTYFCLIIWQCIHLCVYVLDRYLSQHFKESLNFFQDWDLLNTITSAQTHNALDNYLRVTKKL